MGVLGGTLHVGDTVGDTEGAHSIWPFSIHVLKNISQANPPRLPSPSLPPKQDVDKRWTMLFVDPSFRLNLKPVIFYEEYLYTYFQQQKCSRSGFKSHSNTVIKSLCAQKALQSEKMLKAATETVAQESLCWFDEGQFLPLVHTV